MICAYCKEALGAEPLTCSACRTVVHAECAGLHGRCVTLGCSSGRFVAGAALPERRLEPSLPPLLSLRLAIDDATVLVAGLAGAAALVLLG